MKITYETTTKLNQEQLFFLLKESIEKKTGKQLANFHFEEGDNGMNCILVFCNEIVELNNEKA